MALPYKLNDSNDSVIRELVDSATANNDTAARWHSPRRRGDESSEHVTSRSGDELCCAVRAFCCYMCSSQRSERRGAERQRK